MSELNEMKRLMRKLKAIHLELGGEKEMQSGTNRGKGDTFWSLKHDVLVRVKNVKELIADRDTTRDKIDQIKISNQIRKEVDKMTQDFSIMNTTYRKEKMRARSKLSEEEKKKREDAILSLRSELADVAALNNGKKPGAGGVGMDGLGGEEFAALQKQQLFAVSTMTTRAGAGEANFDGDAGNGVSSGNPFGESKGGGGRGGGGGGGGGFQEEALTDAQQQQLVELQEGKDEITQALQGIEKKVLELQDIATMIGEEAKVQNEVIQVIEGKIDDAAGDMKDLNSDLKKAIKESRAENKCIYMICCIVLLAIVGIVVNMLL
jgi:t-SNARE complex subunit (syntaxin)